MADKLDEMQIEFYKILSIAINMAKVNDSDLIPYLEEQRGILQQDIAIENDEDIIKELDAMRKSSSSEINKVV